MEDMIFISGTVGGGVKEAL